MTTVRLHLVVFSSAGALYDDNSDVKDYLGQVFNLMGFDKQEFIFIQGTSMKSRDELVKFSREGALRAVNVVNIDLS